MEKKDVERYYQLKQQMDELDREMRNLNSKMKNEMINGGIDRVFLGEYHVCLRVHDRGEMDKDIVEYLKEEGYSELIQETYDSKKLKDYMKHGLINNEEASRYWMPNTVYALYVSRQSDEI
ncbi:MAG: hypothetical protein Q8930_15110 [Bacillota bacterium]|nr:hypothetical protein [Bacillota bacterium]